MHVEIHSFQATYNCKTLQSYLEKQLIACYREELEDPRDTAPLVAELIRKSLKLAEETARYACSEIAKVGTQWGDDDFGMPIENGDTKGSPGVHGLMKCPC